MRLEPLWSEVKNGYQCVIEYDEYAESPDEMFDDELFLGEVVSRHVAIGREGYSKQTAEAHIPFDEGPWDFDNTDYYDLPERVDSKEELHAVWEERYDRSWDVFPVRYDGREKLYFSNHDDAEGYVFVKLPYKSDLERFAHVDFDSHNLARELLKDWNAYLSGEVYRAAVADEEGDIIECCGGFLDMKSAQEWVSEVVESLTCNPRKLKVKLYHGTLTLPGVPDYPEFELNVPWHIAEANIEKFIFYTRPHDHDLIRAEVVR